MFRQLCGDEGLRNVILVTTMHGLVDDATRNEREADLRANYWSSMEARGAQYARFHRTPAFGHAIIRMLEGRPRVVLGVQREMVDQNRNVGDTAAASTLYTQKAAELAERQRFELEILRERQRWEAQRQHNEYLYRQQLARLEWERQAWLQREWMQQQESSDCCGTPRW